MNTMYVNPTVVEEFKEAVTVNEFNTMGQLFTLGRLSSQHDLPDDVVRHLIATELEPSEHYDTDTPYTEKQLQASIKHWDDEFGGRGWGVEITNFKMEKNLDYGTEFTAPRSMADILAQIKNATCDRVFRIGESVFIDDPKHGICWFNRNKAVGFFAYLKSRFKVTFSRGGGMVSMAEVFAELERTAPQFTDIQRLPHEPMIPGVYYSCASPKPGDGSHLKELLNYFSPETTADRELLKGGLMTAFWGGPAGHRPVFVMTSPDGRGSGKSTTVVKIADVAGGLLDFAANEGAEQMKHRLLSPAAQGYRVALLDNVKSNQLSWPELESMVTMPVISGKQMFVGEAQRPNLLTWFITVNGASLSTDMAQRSVVISLTKPTKEPSWLENIDNFIAEHREEIIADIIAALKTEPKELEEYSRWSTWEREVLCRLENPEELQRVILERQGEADAELSEAETVEEYFAQQIEAFGFDSATAQLRLPSRSAAEWFAAALRKNMTTVGAGRRLHQMMQEGQISRLAAARSTEHGRHYIWTGSRADVVGGRIQNDLFITLQHLVTKGERECQSI